MMLARDEGQKIELQIIRGECCPPLEAERMGEICWWVKCYTVGGALAPLTQILQKCCWAFGPGVCPTSPALLLPQTIVVKLYANPVAGIVSCLRLHLMGAGWGEKMLPLTSCSEHYKTAGQQIWQQLYQQISSTLGIKENQFCSAWLQSYTQLAEVSPIVLSGVHLCAGLQEFIVFCSTLFSSHAGLLPFCCSLSTLFVLLSTVAKIMLSLCSSTPYPFQLKRNTMQMQKNIINCISFVH